MEVLSWAASLALFVFVALAAFGSFASHLFWPTPFTRFCERLFALFQLANLKIVKAIMIVMLALLAVAVIARIVSG
jgi:hypothetical protein